MKSSADTWASRSHDCPGTNYRYSAEKVCLEQEVWSYSLTTAVIDPEICFNEVFRLDQLKEPCLFFHRGIIPDVKTQLLQHYKGRALNDAETALGIQVVSFVW